MLANRDIMFEVRTRKVISLRPCQVVSNTFHITLVGGLDVYDSFI